MFNLYSSPKFKYGNVCSVDSAPVGHLLELGDVHALHAASQQKDSISLAGTYGKYAVIVQKGASYDVSTGEKSYSIELLIDNGRTFRFDIAPDNILDSMICPSIQPFECHLEP